MSCKANNVSTTHKEFFKTTESRKCCPDCGKIIIVHFRTNKQKKQFNKKDSWPDAWSFDYNHGEDTHRFLFFDGSEKQKWIEDNLSFNDPSIFGATVEQVKDAQPNEEREPIDVLYRLLHQNPLVSKDTDWED